MRDVDDVSAAITLLEILVGCERHTEQPKSPYALTHFKAVLGDDMPMVGDATALRRGEGKDVAKRRVAAMAEYLGRISDGLYDLAGYEGN
jgi:hypothetical protein